MYLRFRRQLKLGATSQGKVDP